MKKQLLNESDIRKMMKFANIGALSDGFVERLNETYMEGHDDDHMEEGMDEEELEEGMYDEDMHENEMEDDMEDDMGDDLEGDLEDAPADAGGDATADVLTFVSDAMENFKSALKAAGADEAAEAITVQKDLDGEEMGGGMTSPEAPMSVDAEDDLGMSMVDEPDEMSEPAGEEDDVEPPKMDEGEHEKEDLDEEDLMNEVARRVARRLLQMKRNK